MSRSVILSNGNLNVGLNDQGLVHDFYFPDNGFENHTLGNDLFHKVGLMVNNQMTWLNDGSWQFDFSYPHDALISLTRATNHSLGLRLEFDDMVANSANAFLRNIHVINLAEQNREIRLFLHQNFAINSSRHHSDTVQFLPKEHVILHYRADRAFVISATQMLSSSHRAECTLEEDFACDQKECDNWHNFDQHTVGLFGIERKEGSWRDAEDGELSGCSIEHGQVDSIMRFKFALNGNSSARFQYSISCAFTQQEALKVNALIQKENFLVQFVKTQKYWHNWLEPARKTASKLEPKMAKAFIESLMLAKSHLSITGAPIASNDSEMLNHARDDYSYCWPRDALYAIWPLIRLGYQEEPLKFFDFCQKIITEDGYLMHKYLPNGQLGPSWHPYIQDSGEQNLPIQTDETAGIILLIANFYFKFHDKQTILPYYESLVKPMANFLTDYIGENNLPKPSYELWEMDYLTTTYTTAITYGALKAAADLSREFGDARSSSKWRTTADNMKIAAKHHLFNQERQYFSRGIWPNGEKDHTIDSSSLYGVYLFGLFDLDSNEVQNSIDTLENRFDAHNQIGVPRFENDIYYRDNHDNKSNLWVITSLWRAEYYVSRGEMAKAKEIIAWVISHSSNTGILPEQLDPLDFSWRSVAPLTWSQAELVSALLDVVSSEE